MTEEQDKPDKDQIGEKPEEESFRKFTSTALRAQRKGIYQQLLANLVVKANSNQDPYDMVSNACQAAFLYEAHQQDSETEKGNETKIDMKIVTAAWQVSIALKNTESLSRANTTVIDVAWPFDTSKEYFENYISPWLNEHNPHLTFYPYHARYRQDQYPEHCGVPYGYAEVYEESQEHRSFLSDSTIYIEKDIVEKALRRISKKVSKAIAGMDEHRAFFEKTTALSLSGFQALKGAFTQWAMRSLQPILAVVSSTIDPKIYEEAIHMLMAKAEVKPQDESSLGPG